MYGTYELFGTNQQMKKIMEKACERLMETCQLRRVELDILYIISHAGERDTAMDIVKLQHLSKAHVSKSVDNLKQSGYIALVEDEADRRKVHIRVTSKAIPVMEEFESVRREVLRRLFNGVTEEEKQCLRNVLRKIMQNMEMEGVQ